MQFGPNNTANLKGRPRGRPDKRSKWRAEFEKDAPAAIAKVKEKALKGDGDMEALKFWIGNVLPRLRDESPRRRLALEGGTLEELGRSTVDLLTAGELSPEEFGAVQGGFSRQGLLEQLGRIADTVAALAARAGIEVPPELKLRQHLPATLDQEPSA
jgi:hypothetical protein